MKRLLVVAAVALGMILAASFRFQVRSESNDIVSFVPGGPILLPGIKFPYMNPDQLMGGSTADIVAITQLWSAYVFYHDTHDGARFASLLLPDGVFDQELNQNGTFVPNSGIGARGCVLRGRAQIAEFINLETKNAPPLTFPRAAHKVTSPMIKVDGDEAAMIAPYFGLGGARPADGGAASAGNAGGIYMTKFRRAHDGWQIEANHIVYDRPKTGQDICDLNGPVTPK